MLLYQFDIMVKNGFCASAAAATAGKLLLVRNGGRGAVVASAAVVHLDELNGLEATRQLLGGVRVASNGSFPFKKCTTNIM